MLPSPDILNDFPLGRFVLSNLAAKRAKQLREGAPPLVRTDSNHPLTIALAEIAAGKIKAILPDLTAEPLITEEHPLIDEMVPPELGMLLPALDETERELVTSVALVGEEDHEGEVEAGLEPLSLSDLVVEGEDETPAPIADDDTLSLSDIAEQEAATEDETEE
jgi:DNA-directed RNA polymerase subunit omega